jgi:predicted transcriptional regulator of viral defense system
MKSIDTVNTLMRINKAFFTPADFSKILKLKRESLKKNLGRLVKKRLIKRLGRGIYVLASKGIDSKKIASQLYAPYAYISFESALSTYGILNQIPYAVTMATWKAPKARPLFESEVVLRKIRKDLFFGYVLKDNVLLAEPEKALLDTLYLKSKGLAVLNEEELNLGDISKAKFLKMSRRFPPKVQKEAKRIAARYL